MQTRTASVAFSNLFDGSRQQAAQFCEPMHFKYSVFIVSMALLSTADLPGSNWHLLFCIFLLRLGRKRRGLLVWAGRNLNLYKRVRSSFKVFLCVYFWPESCIVSQRDWKKFQTAIAVKSTFDNPDIVSCKDIAVGGPEARDIKPEMEIPVVKWRGQTAWNIPFESTVKCAMIVRDDVVSHADLLCKMEQWLGKIGARQLPFWLREPEEANMDFVLWINVRQSSYSLQAEKNLCRLCCSPDYLSDMSLLLLLP